MKVYTNNLEAFMNTATEHEKNMFLQYCIKHRVVPDQKQFNTFKKVVLRSNKIMEIGNRIIKDNRIADICDLIWFVDNLIEEVISFGDSEGVDTRTEEVRKAKRWIKENIDDENTN